MTSRPQNAARRKSADERRDEIVQTASELALTEGLESLTLRRVADALGVFPGLVNHYFRSVDDLVAVAFGEAAGRELEELFGMLDNAQSPLVRTREVLRLLVSEDRDLISLLWLDAWHAARRRPALRVELNNQTLAWQSRLADLIAEGVRSGAFHTEDAAVVAMRVLAMIDGLSMQAAMRSTIDYDAVREMVFATTERELGLPAGGLHPTSSLGPQLSGRQ